MSSKAGSFSKYSFVLVIGMIIGMVFITRNPIQSSPAMPQAAGEMLPASATPPPEIQQMEEERRRVPEAPRGQPTMQQLEQRLASIPGGNERMAQAKSKAPGQALPASATPPPEIQQMEEERRRVPEPPRGQPTTQQLEERIRSMPGGPEKLDRARRGARPRAEVTGRAESLLAFLNPFHVLTSHAQSSTNVTADLTHRTDHSTNLNPTGLSVILVGTQENYNAPQNLSRSLLPGLSLSLSDGTSYTAWASQVVTAPASGYYIVSAKLQMSAIGATIKLAHYESGQKVVKQTFPLSTTGWQDYPFISSLTQGTHYFYWVAQSSYPLSISNLHFQSYP